jgi:hypothetical protein
MSDTKSVENQKQLNLNDIIQRFNDFTTAGEEGANNIALSLCILFVKHFGVLSKVNGNTNLSDSTKVNILTTATGGIQNGQSDTQLKVKESESSENQLINQLINAFEVDGNTAGKYFLSTNCSKTFFHHLLDALSQTTNNAIITDEVVASMIKHFLNAMQHKAQQHKENNESKDSVQFLTDRRLELVEYALQLGFHHSALVLARWAPTKPADKKSESSNETNQSLEIVVESEETLNKEYDKKLSTLLGQAIQFGDLNLVKYILANDPDAINATVDYVVNFNLQEETTTVAKPVFPLFIAMQFNQWDIVRHMLELEKKLDLAIEYEHTEIDKKEKKTHSPLMIQFAKEWLMKEDVSPTRDKGKTEKKTRIKDKNDFHMLDVLLSSPRIMKQITESNSQTNAVTEENSLKGKKKTVLPMDTFIDEGGTEKSSIDFIASQLPKPQSIRAMSIYFVRNDQELKLPNTLNKLNKHRELILNDAFAYLEYLKTNKSKQYISHRDQFVTRLFSQDNHLKKLFFYSVASSFIRSIVAFFSLRTLPLQLATLMLKQLGKASIDEQKKLNFSNVEIQKSDNMEPHGGTIEDDSTSKKPEMTPEQQQQKFYLFVAYFYQKTGTVGLKFNSIYYKLANGTIHNWQTLDTHLGLLCPEEKQKNKHTTYQLFTEVATGKVSFNPDTEKVKEQKTLPH